MPCSDNNGSLGVQASWQFQGQARDLVDAHSLMLPRIVNSLSRTIWHPRYVAAYCDWRSNSKRSHIVALDCISCHLQIELTDLVYRKGLRLRGSDVSRMGVGGIANLQSNDVQKMARFALDINPIWDGPFQVRLQALGGLQSLE